MRVIQAFADAGISSQSSAGWLRIKADWRGGDGYSVAVHPDTGGWKDHTTGETGNWKTLAGRLGLEGNALSPLTLQERQSIAQKADEDLRKRTQAAQVLWSKAQPVGKALDNQVELHGLTTTGKMGKRNAEKWVESYLDERNGKEAAIAVGARWASLPKELNGKPEPCILWPMRDFATGELTGIQREWGRRHENKRMLGRHITDSGESAGFILRGAFAGNTIFLCEGMQTAAAVWAATGQTTLCLYDTAGLRNPPITALQKGLGELTGVIVAGDRDVSGAGNEAAQICADKMRSAFSRADIKVQVSLPPQVGTDWADMLAELGREATKEYIVNGIQKGRKVRKHANEAKHTGYEVDNYNNGEVKAMNEIDITKNDLMAGDFVRLEYSVNGQTKHNDLMVIEVNEKGIRGKPVIPNVDGRVDGKHRFGYGDVVSGLEPNGNTKISIHEPNAVPGIQKLDPMAKAGKATDGEKLALHISLNRFMDSRGQAAIKEYERSRESVVCIPTEKQKDKNATAVETTHKPAISVERDDKRDLRAELTNHMATMMEAGELPWQKPWQNSGIGIGAAHNPVSGTTYSGGNRLILTMTALEKGYNSNEWCTFKQAQTQEGAEKDTNWSVKKGEKATYIERWQETPFYNRKSLGLEIKANGKPCGISEEVNGGLKLKDGQVVPKSAITVSVLSHKDGKEMSFAQASYDYNLRFAKPFAVFNLDQMDNVPAREPKVPATEIEMHDRVQMIVKGMQADGLKLETGGDRAYYRPSADKVQMPKPEQFNSLPHYYSTLLHEIGHSTGAEGRLNREGIAGKDRGFGSPAYAKEELVAELASFFAATETGVPRQTDTEHAAYLQNWAKVLREDQNALFKAAKDAGQAVDYILSKEKALELAKDRPVSEPNLDHGRTDGKVLDIDTRTDQLVQSTYGDKVAVVHSLSVAPEAKKGDNLSIRYNKGVSKTVDMAKEQSKKLEKGQVLSHDGGFGRERSLK
jgi:antirestriction protein ArdC